MAGDNHLYGSNRARTLRRYFALTGPLRSKATNSKVISAYSWGHLQISKRIWQSLGAENAALDHLIAFHLHLRI